MGSEHKELLIQVALRSCFRVRHATPLPGRALALAHAVIYQVLDGLEEGRSCRMCSIGICRSWVGSRMPSVRRNVARWLGSILSI
jgi:hypothetical protein